MNRTLIINSMARVNPWLITAPTKSRQVTLCSENLLSSTIQFSLQRPISGRLYILSLESTNSSFTIQQVKIWRCAGLGKIWQFALLDQSNTTCDFCILQCLTTDPNCAVHYEFFLSLVVHFVWNHITGYISQTFIVKDPNFHMAESIRFTTFKIQ